MGRPRKRGAGLGTLTGKRKKAWTAFSKFIRLRDAIATTGTTDSCKCVTCGREYPVHKMHAGHFFPGRSDAVLFDEKGVNAQCYRCNIMLQGVWPAYYRVMKERYGQDWIETGIETWAMNNDSYSDTELEGMESYYNREYQLLKEEYNG